MPECRPPSVLRPSRLGAQRAQRAGPARAGRARPGTGPPPRSALCQRTGARPRTAGTGAPAPPIGASEHGRGGAGGPHLRDAVRVLLQVLEQLLALALRGGVRAGRERRRGAREYVRHEQVVALHRHLAGRGHAEAVARAVHRDARSTDRAADLNERSAGPLANKLCQVPGVCLRPHSLPAALSFAMLLPALAVGISRHCLDLPFKKICPRVRCRAAPGRA